MSPYQIEFLLHYYAHVGDSPELVRNPPILRETIDGFLAMELLRECSVQMHCKMYEITERGRCYVDEGLLCVPLPVWSIKHGEQK